MLNIRLQVLDFEVLWSTLKTCLPSELVSITECIICTDLNIITITVLLKRALRLALLNFSKYQKKVIYSKKYFIISVYTIWKLDLNQKKKAAACCWACSHTVLHYCEMLVLYYCKSGTIPIESHVHVLPFAFVRLRAFLFFFASVRS